MADTKAPRRRSVLNTGLGAPNGPRTAAFDRWFRYPAGFSSEALKQCFDAIHAADGGLVVDPFAGACTAGTRATAQGFAFLGIEAHPLIAELGTLKFTRPATPECLVELAQTLIGAMPVGDPAAEHPLVVRSFNPTMLAQLIGIRTRILRLNGSRWEPYLKWSLLGALRECASVKVGWPYQRPTIPRVPRMADPYRAFARRAGWIAHDISNGSALPRATVQPADARTAGAWHVGLAGRRADVIITSPPYLNNFDYADATRLELYFWGVVSSWREMTSQIRTGMVTASTQQSRKAEAAKAAISFAADCPQTARKVHDLTEALGRERAARRRGKEYDQVLPSYFEDLKRVLINVRHHARCGAQVVLVLGDSAPYGVYIDTPGLLAASAEELGFTRDTVRPLRRRGLRWRTNGTRHAVALTEQLVVLRAPGPR